MPLIETKGAASAQGFGEFAKTSVATYIEDVFSTYLYTGNGSTQTITNGIDLSTKGGLVWVKSRSVSGNNWTQDTARGVNSVLYPNLTNAAGNPGGTAVSSFDTTGFTLGTNTNINNTGDTYASWTFRKQPKFFDVVTYTGTGANRTVAHNLGSVPGCIITKRTDTTGNWITYHRSLGNTDFVNLNTTAATSADSGAWNNTTPTSTEFSLGTGNTNVNGGTYVAYLFAHDAGGFGLTGTDNVISCGSFTGNTTVNLGYEPQWLLIKNYAGADSWTIMDNMRGMPNPGNSVALLRPNTSGAEGVGQGAFPTATGFTTTAYSGLDCIYIAIRRGPMKTPTSGTSVFSPNSTSTPTVTTNFPVDMVMDQPRSTGGFGNYTTDRLRGGGNYVQTFSTAAESSGGFASTQFQSNTQVTAGIGAYPEVFWSFRRAPGFFDEVCGTFTSGGSYETNIRHNLGVTPELVIMKMRGVSSPWGVTAPAGYLLVLNSDESTTTANTTLNLGVYALSLTATTFWARRDSSTYGGQTFVAYLFASCPGVSKVGTYTGTGALQTIDCGFTGGARFVLIKRRDSTGDWYVYDSARGISSGNDPYLLLNSTAGEITGTNYVDTTSVGFQVTAAAPAALNANGGTFLFLAVA